MVENRSIQVSSFFSFCFLFKKIRIRMKERFAAKRANSQREAEFSLAIHREITEHRLHAGEFEI